MKKMMNRAQTYGRNEHSVRRDGTGPTTVRLLPAAHEGPHYSPPGCGFGSFGEVCSDVRDACVCVCVYAGRKGGRAREACRLSRRRRVRTQTPRAWITCTPQTQSQKLRESATGIEIVCIHVLSCLPGATTYLTPGTILTERDC